MMELLFQNIRMHPVAVGIESPTGKTTLGAGYEFFVILFAVLTEHIVAVEMKLQDFPRLPFVKTVSGEMLFCIEIHICRTVFRQFLKVIFPIRDSGDAV